MLFQDHAGSRWGNETAVKGALSLLAHPLPMPVFAYSIAADQDRRSEGDGFVRSETIQQAVALVGHPDANVYPLPAGAVWPGEHGEAVWQCA